MRFVRVLTLFAVAVIVSASAYFAMPYVRAASLFVRVGNVGGPLERLADAIARDVTVLPRQRVPVRQGEVETQLYRPQGTVRRSVLLVPGVHSMGIAEPRLTALAHDLAGSGVAVMTMALPDLMAYQITARSADVIEDVVAWMAAQPELAPDGRVGMIGISFAGGLSIVAAGRPSIRDKVAYVVSFGGHGDLGRVLHYLATGEAVHAPGVKTIPPHDYGVAVILYAAADRMVPALLTPGKLAREAAVKVFVDAPFGAMLAHREPDARGLLLVELDGFIEDILVFLQSSKIYRLEDGAGKRRVPPRRGQPFMT